MSSPIAPRGDSPRIGGLIQLAWRHVRERIYAGVRAEGYDDLNPAHVALFLYEGLDGWRPTQLAEQMQITRQSINDLLRRVERHGYVKLRPDPVDSRARLVYLTARGRWLDAAVRAHAAAAEREFADATGQRPLQELRDMLSRIVELAEPLAETWARRADTGPRGGDAAAEIESPNRLRTRILKESRKQSGKTSPARPTKLRPAGEDIF